MIADVRGPAAEPLVERIDKLARAYPWAGEYSVWPGPNSNTFTAWILRGVPELKADLPPTAIGKDYNGGTLVDTAPSGGGFQFSAIGLLGLTASGVEGLELNVLGLTFGINPFDPALKLPILGRLGPAGLHGAAQSIRKLLATPSLSNHLTCSLDTNNCTDRLVALFGTQAEVARQFRLDRAVVSSWVNRAVGALEEVERATGKNSRRRNLKKPMPGNRSG